MSLPNVPDINPEITLRRKDAINLLLTSIAMEEMGISHVLNAEGEKIQHVLKQHPTIKELLRINRSVERILRTLIKKEIILQFKMENILDLLNENEVESEDEDCDFNE